MPPGEWWGVAAARGQGAQPGCPLLLQTFSGEEGSGERAVVGTAGCGQDLWPPPGITWDAPPGLSSATVSSSDLAGGSHRPFFRMTRRV